MLLDRQTMAAQRLCGSRVLDRWVYEFPLKTEWRFGVTLFYPATLRLKTRLHWASANGFGLAVLMLVSHLIHLHPDELGYPTMWPIPWCIWCYPSPLWTDTRLWKHYLPQTSFAAGNYMCGWFAQHLSGRLVVMNFIHHIPSSSGSFRFCAERLDFIGGRLIFMKQSIIECKRTTERETTQCCDYVLLRCYVALIEHFNTIPCLKVNYDVCGEIHFVCELMQFIFPCKRHFIKRTNFPLRRWLKQSTTPSHNICRWLPCLFYGVKSHVSFMRVFETNDLLYKLPVIVQREILGRKTHMLVYKCNNLKLIRVHRSSHYQVCYMIVYSFRLCLPKMR